MKPETAKPAKRRGAKHLPARTSPSPDLDPGKFLKGFFGAEEQESKAARREAEAKREEEHRAWLRQIAPRHDYVANLIRQHANKCFFYPASGLDWRPLYWCSSQCDLFIYCDWNVEASLVDEEIERRAASPETRLIGQGMQYDEARRITGTKLKWWTTTPFHLEPPPAFLYQPPYVSAHEQGSGFNAAYTVRRSLWGRQYTLRRIVGDQKREITLLYLGVEGVAVYWQYFAGQGMAPKCLHWEAANGCGAGNWTEFGRWEAALGRAVDAGSRKPTYVVPRGEYDWPWNQPEHPFPDWDMVFYSRRPTKRSNEERL